MGIEAGAVSTDRTEARRRTGTLDMGSAVPYYIEACRYSSARFPAPRYIEGLQ